MLAVKTPRVSEQDFSNLCSSLVEMEARLFAVPCLTLQDLAAKIAVFAEAGWSGFPEDGGKRSGLIIAEARALVGMKSNVGHTVEGTA